MEILLSLKKWIEAGGNRRKWFVGLFLVSLVITGILFITSGGSEPGTAIEPDPLYFTGVIIKLISVLLLIIGGAVLLRRWQVKGGFQRRHGQLNILETIRLSPRQAIHLVRVGDQHLLIGATDQSINILSQVEINEVVGQPETVNLPGPAVNFGQVLESMSASKPVGAVDVRNTASLTDAAGLPDAGLK